MQATPMEPSARRPRMRSAGVLEAAKEGCPRFPGVGCARRRSAARPGVGVGPGRHLRFPNRNPIWACGRGLLRRTVEPQAVEAESGFAAAHPVPGGAQPPARRNNGVPSPPKERAGRRVAFGGIRCSRGVCRPILRGKSEPAPLTARAASRPGRREIAANFAAYDPSPSATCRLVRRGGRPAHAHAGDCDRPVRSGGEAAGAARRPLGAAGVRQMLFS